MKPLLLRMTGFKSFVKEQSVDFVEISRDGIFGICGDTGSGKSSILSAILYALYGKRGDNEQVLNVKADRLSVELSFEAQGKVYQVARSLSKSKGGNITKSAKLFEVDGADLIPLTEKNDTAVTKEVTGLIGLDLNDFTQCVVLEQGGYDKFLNLSRLERISAMERIFKLDRYGERLSDKLKLKKEASTNLINQLTTRIEERSQYTESALKQAKKQLTKLSKDREELVRRKAQATLALNEAQNGLKSAEEARVAREQLDKCVDELKLLMQEQSQQGQQIEADTQAFAQIKQKNQSRIEQLNSQKAKMTALKPLFDSIKELEGKSARLQEAVKINNKSVDSANEICARLEQRAQDCQSQQQQILQDLSQRGADYSDLISAQEGLQQLITQKRQRERELTGLATIKQKIADKEALVYDAGGRASRLHAQLSGAQTELLEIQQEVDSIERQNLAVALTQKCKIGDNCPVCGGKIQRFEACGTQEIELLRVRMTEKQAQCEGLKVERDRARLLNSTASAELELLNSQLKEGLTNQNSQIDAVNASAQHLAQFLEQIKGLLVDVSSVQKQQQTNKEDLIRLGASLQASQNELGLLARQREDTIDRLGGLDLTNYEDDLRGIADELKALTEEIDKRTADITKKQTQLEQIKRQIALKNGVEQQLNARLTELGRVKQCSEQDFLQASQVAKDIEQAINDNSAQTGAITVQLETAITQLAIKNECMRDKAQAVEKNKIIEELYGLVRSNRFLEFIVEEKLQSITARASERLSGITNGKFELSYGSTGFLVVDNFNGGLLRPATTLSGGEAFLASLCLALSISAEISRDRDIGFFFLDEGFGTLDNELVGTVMNAFERLKEQSLTIGLISHRAELTHRLSTKLSVKKMEGEGSIVLVE